MQTRDIAEDKYDSATDSESEMTHALAHDFPPHVRLQYTHEYIDVVCLLLQTSIDVSLMLFVSDSPATLNECKCKAFYPFFPT